jgi:hypothetical protein
MWPLAATTETILEICFRHVNDKDLTLRAALAHFGNLNKVLERLLRGFALTRRLALMNLYLVGDVAAELGITDNGVRLLERTGVCPVFARTVGGVRLFDAATVARVKRARSRRRLSSKR